MQHYLVASCWGFWSQSSHTLPGGSPWLRRIQPVHGKPSFASSSALPFSWFGLPRARWLSPQVSHHTDGQTHACPCGRPPGSWGCPPGSGGRGLLAFIVLPKWMPSLWSKSRSRFLFGRGHHRADEECALRRRGYHGLSSACQQSAFWLPGDRQRSSKTILLLARRMTRRPMVTLALRPEPSALTSGAVALASWTVATRKNSSPP